VAEQDREDEQQDFVDQPLTEQQGRQRGTSPRGSGWLQYEPPFGSVDLCHAPDRFAQTPDFNPQSRASRRTKEANSDFIESEHAPDIIVGRIF
jgi:hypothetical protein